MLVTGASGFVGSHLAADLVQRGYEVRAMTRRPEDYSGPGKPVAGDVSDPGTLPAALDGVEAAYYLVHSLGSADFEQRDAAAAGNFAVAAADAGLQRIVYLGGLGGDGQLSAHLRSRRAVEEILRAGPVPVTVLRAAVIIGHGGISWEITRELVDRLPLMPTPSWAKTRTQPIALPDAVRYLVGVLEASEAAGQTYEIGGPEVLRYVDMLQRAADVQGKDFVSVPLPLVTPGMSADWVATIAGVDVATARNLVESMTTEVVVHDDAVTRVVPGATMGYDDAVRLALEERARSWAARQSSSASAVGEAASPL